MSLCPTGAGLYHIPAAFFTPGTRQSVLCQAVESATPPPVVSPEICGLNHSPEVCVHEPYSRQLSRMKYFANLVILYIILYGENFHVLPIGNMGWALLHVPAEKLFVAVLRNLWQYCEIRAPAKVSGCAVLTQSICTCTSYLNIMWCMHIVYVHMYTCICTYVLYTCIVHMSYVLNILCILHSVMHCTYICTDQNWSFGEVLASILITNINLTSTHSAQDKPHPPDTPTISGATEGSYPPSPPHTSNPYTREASLVGPHSVPNYRIESQ